MPKALLSLLTLIVTCALPASALAAPATPTFGPRTAFDANTSGGLPKSVTKGNFNNDSYDDAAITSSFTYREPDGTLRTSVSTYEYVGGPAGLTRLGYNESASSGLDGFIDTTGDVNGDGTDEVIRVNLIASLNASSLSAVDFAAAGGGMEATYGAIVPGVLTDLVVGNFLPADNALEIAVRAGSGQIVVYDVSAGALVATRTIAAPAGRLGVLDYDTSTIPADNADDILVGAMSSGPVMLYLNGAGIFTARADLMTTTVEPGATVGFGRGDLNADARNDFATTAQTAAGATSFAGAHSSALGSYVHASDSAVSATSYPALAPVVGNYLAGGRDDSVVFADAASILSYATGDSTPARTSFALAGAVRSAAAVDVNGDGRDDLVTIGADGTAQTYYSVIANTQIIQAPSPLTNSANASFTFQSDVNSATFECSLDAGAYTTCVSPKLLSGLSDAQHAFSVRAIDASGTDATPATHAWTVDTTAPQTTIDAGPDGAMSSTTATVAFSSDDATATFQCALDDEPFFACESPKTYTGLSLQVEHNVFVRAVDAGGNVDQTVAYRYWYIDQSAPDTSITAAPDTLTTSHAAQFAFSSPTINDATFECRLDGGEFAACDSPQDYGDLADGEHSFDVRAINAQAVIDDTPASHSWTVDSTAPATTITGKPADPATSTAATFEFTSDDAGATFECKLDGGAFEACTSPQGYSGLSQGSHTFELRAGDAIGNAGAAVSHTWVVDSVRPTATITDIPGSPWNSSDVAVAFSSDDTDATFECKLDDGAFAPCASPKDYTGLSDGQHDFEVRATDGLGNIGEAATGSWTVDTATPAQTAVVPPTLPPTTPPPPATPPAPTQPSTPTVSRDASSLRVVVARRGALRNARVPVGCRLDAGRLASCTVRAYANDVRVGAGAQTFTSGRLGSVRVKLTARGLRLVQRVGGVRLTFRATATTAAAKTLRGRAISRVLPLRAVAVSTDGVFGAGSARLTATGRRYVKALAADLGDAALVVCTGHTDSVGSAASNQRLGSARAKSVCSQLRDAGVRAELHSRSAGERQPRAHNDTARGRALNRRVELTVSYR